MSKNQYPQEYPHITFSTDTKVNKSLFDIFQQYTQERNTLS